MLVSNKKDKVCITDSDDDDDMDSIVHVTTVYLLESNSDSSEEERTIEVARAAILMTEVLPLSEKAGQVLAELQ